MREQLIDKAKGCLTGLAIGDALGVHSEGKTPAQIKKTFGFITDFISENPSGSDDTEFALFNALILIKYGRNIKSHTVAEEWKKYILPHEGPYKGAGFSELMAIENLKRGLEPPYSGMHAHSWSDGLAMRAAPFGIVYPGNPEEACRLTFEDGIVTHSHEGIYSAMAVAAAISMAMSDSSMNEIYIQALNSIPKDSWGFRSISKGIEIGESSVNSEEVLFRLYDELACSYYRWGDLAPEAVGLSFGVIAASRGDFSKAVLGGVNIGRDTDTIAAIAGAIMGAKVGYNNIPLKWRDKVATVNGRCIDFIRDINLLTVAQQLTEIISVDP